MSVPISGLIVMAVAMWFMFMRPDDLVLLAVVMNAFAAASVVNIGGGFPIGIAPYYFIAALVTVRLLPRWIAGKVPFFEGEPAASYARVMALFVSVCVFSALILPNLFEGLPVDVARAGVASYRQIPLAPLHWSLSNGGQAVYMVLNFFVILEFLRKCNDEGFSAMLGRAFTLAGLLAAGVGLFQVACNHVGVKFPAWLINSNVAWAQNTEQGIAGFNRMSATFVEPSDAGRFFACWMVFELTLAMWSRRAERWHWLFASVATVLLFLTTSSTGYVIAAVSWSVAVMQMVGTLFRTGIIRVRKAAAIIGAVGGGVLVLLFVPGVWNLLNAVLFEKANSGSGIDRTATFGRAANVFFETWGLGAGLGSNRAMSVPFYVLSNLGLLGAFLFVYLIAKPYLIARIATRSPEISQQQRAFIRAAGAAFAANLVSMLVSVAEITGPQFWILLGILLAGLRQAWLFENGVLGVPACEWSILHDDPRRPEAFYGDAGNGLRPTTS
jgi:hypothetical protein